MYIVIKHFVKMFIEWINKSVINNIDISRFILLFELFFPNVFFDIFMWFYQRKI